jgi:23S rRNA (uracil1939-C5)-methyltransferase
MARRLAQSRWMWTELPETTLTIEYLGPTGDGVGRTPAGTVFVPKTVPGDVINLSPGGDLLEVITPSPWRTEPFCPEFGRCGGCAMQHVALPTYASWKREIVARALAKAGLPDKVEPTITAHGAGRRRASIHVRFNRGEPTAGFMAARSHDLMALETCPIMAPGMAGAFHAAREAARPLAARNKPLDVQVIATDNGLDVDIRGHGAPDEQERQKLIRAAEFLDLARISIHRDVIVTRKPPVIRMGAIPVTLPPRAFLQATAEAEEVLGSLVVAAVGKAKTVADLFAGVGPFALRLAERAKMFAADGDAPAIAALLQAHRSVQGLKPLNAEARDLFRRPLLPMELNAFDAVVMDPPRAGAEAQAVQLAASKVKRVVSVSCDLQSFIRDALILTKGGYTLETVTPVDQFAWSRHIELVGVFRR